MKLLFLLLNVCVCVVVGRNVMDQHLEEKIEESFSEREMGCKDTYPECKQWATGSGCEADDSEWMAEHCKSSCGKCTNSGPPKPKPGNAGNGCGIQGNSRGNSYIRNGQDADEGEWPWQVLLRTKVVRWDGEYEGTCGGTIISPHCVITAAHCIGEEGEQTVYAGLHDGTKLLGSNVQKRVVNRKRVTIHPRYTKSDPYHGIVNDVAVIKLDEPFDFTSRYVNAACLPTVQSNTYAGQDGTATGFGRISSYNEEMAGILQELRYPINANDAEVCKQCNSIGQCKFPEQNTICAAVSREGAEGTCKGDSGGPLVVKGADNRWTIVGITSYGLKEDCFSANYFMRVTSYLDFINEECQ